MKDRLPPSTAFSRFKKATLPALGLLAATTGINCAPNHSIPTPTAITRPATLPTPEAPVGLRPLSTPIVKAGPEIKRPAIATPEKGNQPSSELSDGDLVKTIHADIVAEQISPDPEETNKWMNFRQSWQRQFILTNPRQTALLRMDALSKFLKESTANTRIKDAAGKFSYAVNGGWSGNNSYADLALVRNNLQVTIVTSMYGQEIAAQTADPLEITYAMVRIDTLRNLVTPEWFQQKFTTQEEAERAMKDVLAQYPQFKAQALEAEVKARVEQMGREGKVVPAEHNRAWEAMRFYYTNRNNPNFTKMWSDYANLPQIADPLSVQ